MTLFEITAILMVLTALFSYINYRVLRMPTTIGVMIIALIVSLGFVALGWLGLEIGQANVARILKAVDFNQALLHGMLSFLLFAGAMHITLDDLASEKWAITLLATVGVVTSTLIVGGLTWVVLDSSGNPDLVHLLSSIRRTDLTDRSGGCHRHSQDRGSSQRS